MMAVAKAADDTGYLKADRLEVLVRLRVLVSYLGEKDQFNWWPTSFLSPTGLRYLGLNFPRTFLAAGVASVSQVAKEFHDQRIGRGSTFHLFRLPHTLERDVHVFLAGTSDNKLMPLIENRNEALVALEELTEGEVINAQGSVRVSGLSQLLTHRSTIKKTAACYRHAFDREYLSFPYFTTE